MVINLFLMKINKFINLLLLLTIFNSCALVPSISVPSYIIDSNTNNLKLNTKDGKWLLCEVAIPSNIYTEVINDSKSILSPKFGNLISFFLGSSALIPYKLSFDLDENILNDIYKGTGYAEQLNSFKKINNRLKYEVYFFGFCFFVSLIIGVYNLIRYRKEIGL